MVLGPLARLFLHVKSSVIPFKDDDLILSQLCKGPRMNSKHQWKQRSSTPLCKTGWHIEIRHKASAVKLLQSAISKDFFLSTQICRHTPHTTKIVCTAIIPREQHHHCDLATAGQTADDKQHRFVSVRVLTCVSFHAVNGWLITGFLQDVLLWGINCGFWK